MKELRFPFWALMAFVALQACSEDSTSTEAGMANQQWTITDSITVELEFSQVIPFDYFEDRKLFLANTDKNDHIIFDENGAVLHKIEPQPAGAPDHIGDMFSGVAFIGNDELLFQPNMQEKMFIVDFDGKVLKEVPVPFRVFARMVGRGAKSFRINNDTHLLYAPGRYNTMEMGKNGYREPLFEIWNRTNNTFSPTLVLPEDHPHTEQRSNRFFPELFFKDGKAFIYDVSEPEIYMYQWDGADFQLEKTIRPNFPKFVRVPVKAGGELDFGAVNPGRIFFIDLLNNELQIVYKEGIEEARFSTMSKDEKQMSEITEPMYKVASINLSDFSESYQSFPREVIPILTQAGDGRWVGLKNIYLKMEEEDFPTLYILERR